MSPMKLATSTTALSKQQQQQVLMDQHHQTLDATANNSTINNTTIQQSFNNYVLRPSNSTASNLNDPSAAYSVQGGGLGGGSGTTAILTNAHSVNDLDEVGAATLPQYRPAPDYETAIRNKYGIVQKPQQLPPLQQQQTNLQQQQLMYNSQPSLITDALLQHQQQQQQQHHQQQQQQQQHQQNNQNHFQQQPQHYHPNHTFGGHNITLDPQQQQHNLQYAENTYSSTPELNRVNLSRHGGPALSGDATQDQIVAELQRLNLYKPPPPYPGPYAKLSSTSTPDLAGGSNFGGGSNLVGMGGSSPDLVSRRNLSGARHHHMENGIHRTFGNLHAMDKGDNQVLANDYRNALSTEELRNESVVYRIENNNILSTPSNYVAYSRTVSEEPIYQNQQQVAAMTSSQNLLDENGEPIYQNLPVHEKILYKQRLQQQQQKEHELLKQQVLMQQQQTTNSEQPQQLQPESAQEEIETNASDSIHIDETVESADPLQNAILNPKVASMAPDMLITSSKLKGHVSRVAITNSRENLHSDSHVFNIQDHNHSDQSPEKKKSVTKISIGAVKAQEEKENFAFPEKVPRKAAPPPPPPPSLHHLPKEPASSGFVQLDSESSTVVSANVRKNNLINSKKSTALPGTSSSSSSYTSSHHQDNLHRAMNAAHPEHDEVLDDPVARHQLEQRRKKSSTTDYSFNFTGVVDAASSSSSTPRTPSSKPRAGRKRWALNFGSKTGSLKSVKSESGSHKSQDSLDGSSTLKSGFGPMMMATLHGLTRSRPDLLAESMATFSQPSKMPKDEIGTYLESKLEEGEVLREFERIPKKKHQNCHFNVAVMAENIPRNRFKDVLPYDENRVKLTTADKDNKSGYINASHVSATVGPDQRFYIAAQGPLPHTIHQFWQMVMQCDVYLIVMLTEASAAPKTSSCIPYWPTKDAASVDLGDFRIVNKYSNVDEANGSDNLYVTSRFQVTHLPTKTKRTVWHLQYSDWSDHGCPSNVKRYIEFLEEVSALRSHTSTEIPVGRNRNPPVLVHCSAGVGRTGVTILCDILLYCVDHNMDIDIPKVLSHLRQQRMLMVQTIAQYKFVHTVLINYLKQSRLI